MANQIWEISTDGTISHYVGAKSKCNCQVRSKVKVNTMQVEIVKPLYEFIWNALGHSIAYADKPMLILLTKSLFKKIFPFQTLNRKRHWCVFQDHVPVNKI